MERPPFPGGFCKQVDGPIILKQILMRQLCRIRSLCRKVEAGVTDHVANEARMLFAPFTDFAD